MGLRNITITQIRANTEIGASKSGEYARTIYNPISLSLGILSDRNQLKILLALGITWVRRRRVLELFLLVFVMLDTPCVIDRVLDISIVLQL